MVAIQTIGRTASRVIERGVNKIANSDFMKKAFSERAGEIAATVALASTTTKDAVNCIYYTKQSYQNKKIPKENRGESPCHCREKQHKDATYQVPPMGLGPHC